MSARADSADRAPPARSRRALIELLALDREMIELEYVRRSDALERVRDAVRRLGEIGSPQGILERAAEELGEELAVRPRADQRGGDRGMLEPRAIWSADDEAGALAALDSSRRARSGSSIR